MLATGSLVSGARADDVQADVGGGAAGVIADLTLQSWDLGPTLFKGNDTADYVVSTPRVVMGKNGGNFSVGGTNRTVAGLAIHAVNERIKGNRHGTPFAEANSDLVDIHGTTGALAGVSIGALNVHCRWDTTGATGETTVVDANGNKTQPAVGETHDLGDLGYITFNEQYTDTVYLLDANGNGILGPDGEYLYAQTLYVIGAHIHLFEPLDFINGYAVQDIQLGFTSCDPLKLPPLTGVKLSQTST